MIEELNIEELDKPYRVNCGHCGKGHPFALTYNTIQLLGYIRNTECSFCGKLLAQVRFIEDE